MQLEPRTLVSSTQPQHTWTRGHTKTLKLEVKGWSPTGLSVLVDGQDLFVCEM